MLQGKWRGGAFPRTARSNQHLLETWAMWESQSDTNSFTLPSPSMLINRTHCSGEIPSLKECQELGQADQEMVGFHPWKWQRRCGSGTWGHGRLRVPFPFPGLMVQPHSLSSFFPSGVAAVQDFHKIPLTLMCNSWEMQVPAGAEIPFHCGALQAQCINSCYSHIWKTLNGFKTRDLSCTSLHRLGFNL